MSAAIDPALIAAAVRLAEVLARENAALAALDLAGAAAMLAEKQHAGTAFALAWERARPLAPIADARDVVALARRLEAASVENRRLLERGIVVQNRVLAAVARAVPRALAARGPARYGAGGIAPPPRGAPLTLWMRA